MNLDLCRETCLILLRCFANLRLCTLYLGFHDQFQGNLCIAISFSVGVIPMGNLLNLNALRKDTYVRCRSVTKKGNKMFCIYMKTLRRL